MCMWRNRDEWSMIKKIEILGIQLDNYTVREAMARLERYLNSTGMSTIEAISMEMLVQAKEDRVLRESIESLDLAIIDEKEILEIAGADTIQRLWETEEKQFFKEFMKRTMRNGRTVYLFGETKEQVKQLRDFLRDDYGRLKVIGSFALGDCMGDYDSVVNEVNILSPDIILSVVSTPEQEYFLMESKGKMNAAVWYGLGNHYAKTRGVHSVGNMIRRLCNKGVLRSMLSKYNKEN